MNANVDLRQLAVRREQDSVALRRPRALLTRYVLPGIVLAGFLGLLAWSLREQWISAQPVTVVPVLATRAEVQQEGTPLFQAAGWVEPRPVPVTVTAYAEGVVEELLVVEGQGVKVNEIVAKMNPVDAILAVKAAKADLALREAELASAQAAEKAGKSNLEHPTMLQAALAEAEAALVHKETHAATMPFQIKAAQARAALAKANFEAKKELSRLGGAGELQFAQAKTDLETAAAALAELEAHFQRLPPEVQALKNKAAALRNRLELKIDERRHAEEAAANVKSVQAKLDQARIALEQANLKLQRMNVRSPVAGRVLSLIARPGMRLMGLSNVSLHDASTVVLLYDPQKLQIRADVRLDDVPRVQPGMKVKIQTAANPAGPLDGEVLYPTSQADIQKNTLQVKVAVAQPPPALRPDMLVHVTFLAPPQPKDKGSGTTMRLLAPRRLVETGEGGPRLWIADQTTQTARLRPVRLGLLAGDLIEILDGLQPGDRLIAGGRDGLREGQRIRVTAEE